MGFLACEFRFDGQSSLDYELELGSIGQSSDDNSSFVSGPTISDDYLPRNYRSHFYGVSRPDKLTFQFSCMLQDFRLDEEDYLTRAEIADIAQWLTGPDTYRWLEFMQDDMYHWDVVPGNRYAVYRYRCLITGLELQFINSMPVGFIVTVTCDSPYAYAQDVSSSKTVASGASATLAIENTGSPEAGVKPTIEVQLGGTPTDPVQEIKIVNQTTGEQLSLTNVPTSVSTISIDCERGVITSNAGVNLYSGFNFVFPKLARGRNVILIDGTNCPVSLTVTVSFTPPVDIGA